MLKQSYKKIVFFLNNEKINYIVIGGIAVSVIGNPRETIDIDFCVFIKKSDIKNLLDKMTQADFTVDKEKILKNINLMGCFNIKDRNVRIDFIIASHKFEKSAFDRKISVEMLGVKAYYPTPEDLILLKIVPGRLRDLADVEDIAIRHSGKLNEKYLLSWAQKLSDEAQDLRIFKEVQRILKL